MQACMKKTETNLKNGMRYLLLDIVPEGETAGYKFEPNDGFGHIPVADYGIAIEPRCESFWMSEVDVIRKLRLTFAVTYFSAQAVTIRHPLRLEETRHPHFTTRHLIVGLGRAPFGGLAQLSGYRPRLGQ